MGQEGRAVAIGAFDGVHMGHQAIVRLAVESARRRRVPSMVITFEPNPLAVLRPEFKTTVLTDSALRARLMERLGVDELLEIPFTKAFSHIRWDRFCDILTAPPIGAQTIAVGRNFRFGHGGAGTARMLREHGRSRGIRVEIPQLVTSPDGKPISSTRIRRLIAQGEVEEVIPLLARPHCLRGTVVRGDGRGKALGIPTANIAVAARAAVPGRAVYAGRVSLAGHWWPAAVNVGHAPTFRDSGHIRIEALLIDYDGPDLYGERADVAFLSRLRPERRFDSADALIAQIERDIAHVRLVPVGSESPLC